MNVSQDCGQNPMRTTFLRAISTRSGSIESIESMEELRNVNFLLLDQCFAYLPYEREKSGMYNQSESSSLRL